MNSANAKRNAKNRAYRSRKQFRDLLDALPTEMMKEIMSFSPLSPDVMCEFEREFLAKKRREIVSRLDSVDTCVIYQSCTKGLLSKWAKDHRDVKYCPYSYSKYDSFLYDPSGFWIDRLPNYYSRCSNNAYIRETFIRAILELISKDGLETSIMRKRILAIQMDFFGY